MPFGAASTCHTTIALMPIEMGDMQLGKELAVCRSNQYQLPAPGISAHPASAYLRTATQGSEPATSCLADAHGPFSAGVSASQTSLVEDVQCAPSVETVTFVSTIARCYVSLPMRLSKCAAGGRAGTGWQARTTPRGQSTPAPPTRAT